MKFQPTFRASAYLSLCLATFCLGLTEANFVYPALMALAAIAAYYLTDKSHALVLPRVWSNLLALVVTVAAYYEYTTAADVRGPLLPVTHWAVYLQMIRGFHRKKTRDYWYLYFVGILQIAVAGALNTRFSFAPLLGLYAFVTLWSLVLFFLWRESERYAPPRPAAEPGSVDALGPRRRRPMPVVTRRLAAGTLFMGLSSILWAMAFFFLVPRIGRTWAEQPASYAKHVTGFDVKVKLGELGEILESHDQVFRAKLVDQDGNVVLPGRELLWRGVALSEYRRGRWSRNEAVAGYALGGPASPLYKKFIRQIIEIEPLDTETVFGLFPIDFTHVEADEQGAILYDPTDGCLLRKENLRRRRLQYVLYAMPQVVEGGPITNLPPTPDGGISEVAESFLSTRRLGGLARLRRVVNLRHIPRELTTPPDLPRLVALAQNIVADIPFTDHEARARALSRYLTDSGEFGYTLSQTRVDPNIDPVEDFLFNRKEGHCEYFASSLALMLRAVGIPSRVVNGFKGGDWNELAGFYQIRQKDAHSWVEACILPSQAWLTLDPTPAEPRRALMPALPTLARTARKINEYADHMWNRYLIGFDASVQAVEIYRPLQDFGRQTLAAAAPSVTWTRTQLTLTRDLLADRRTWSDWRGMILIALIAVLLAALFQLLRLLIRWLIRLAGLAQTPRHGAPLTHTFYTRLIQLLARHGLRRRAADTPLEFAHAAAAQIFNRTSAPAADVPPQVVRSFYAVRFGHQTITAADEAHLMAQLDHLELALNQLQPAHRRVPGLESPSSQPSPS